MKKESKEKKPRFIKLETFFDESGEPAKKGFSLEVTGINKIQCASAILSMISYLELEEMILIGITEYFRKNKAKKQKK